MGRRKKKIKLQKEPTTKRTAFPKFLLVSVILACLAVLFQLVQNEEGPPALDRCEDQVSDWLNSNISAPGYHLLCFRPVNGSILALIWLDGLERYHMNYTIRNVFDMQALRANVEFNLGFKNTDAHSQQNGFLPWLMSFRNGSKANSFDSIFSELILIFEGGMFIYPGVHIGFIRSLQLTSGQTINMQTLSLDPPLFMIEDFLSNEECKNVIQEGQPLLESSEVLHTKQSTGPSSKWRTSSTAWLQDSNSFIDSISKRVSDIAKVDERHQEPVQVLKYARGEKYDFHYDFYHPDLYTLTEKEKHLQGGSNRFLTFVWYLNDVEKGGWTSFPRAHRGPNLDDKGIKSLKSCKRKSDTHVLPKMRSVILFYNLYPDGDVNPHSLHGACPPYNEKWAANKWVWNRPLDSLPK